MKNQGKEKKPGFWKEFKAFISKGNVMDLAVAVVLGAAFTAIVNGFVNGIINPLISLAVGKADLSDLVIVMKPAVTDAAGAVVQAATELKYGMFLQAVINFLIIGLCLFCGMKIVMAFAAKTKKLAELAKADLERKNGENGAEEAPQAAPAEEALPAPQAAPAEEALSAPEAAPAAPHAETPAPAVTDKTELLLTEIRDLLKAQAGSPKERE